MREAVGEIDCPLCKRTAELHASAERLKLDPDAAPDGKGKPAYPRKFFVVCPPIAGWRGCGTILANGSGAQIQLMEIGRLHGPDGQPARRKESAPVSQQTIPATSPPPSPVAKTAPANPFRFWAT